MAWNDDSLLEAVKDLATFYRKGDRVGNARHLLWWAGWHPILAVVVGVFYAGIPWAILGTIYVRFRMGSVMTEYGRFAEKTTRTLLQQHGDDVECYTLKSSRRGRLLAGYNRYHEVTNLLVDENSVTIHESLKFDAASRMPLLKDSSRELFYDQITSISYTAGHLEISTSGGEVARYRSSRKPGDAMNDLQEKVRQYKN